MLAALCEALIEALFAQILGLRESMAQALQRNGRKLSGEESYIREGYRLALKLIAHKGQ